MPLSYSRQRHSDKKEKKESGKDKKEKSDAVELESDKKSEDTKKVKTKK